MSETDQGGVMPTGTVLGGAYRLTRLIGSGGMGGVYEAVQIHHRKRVAVKIMSRELAAHPEALARFRREVKVTSGLAHRHIVEVVDFGASPTGEPYLVMEYLDGEDLERRLGREGRLPAAAAVQIVNQLASALAVAHGEGIVHRDLKPANVFLLGAPGGAVFVKVVDFGVSKVLKASTTKLTRARMVVGTPEYMAPEQAAGKLEEINHRSDQWSLACIAWHMLSGHLPFNNADVNALLYQLMYEDPTPLGPHAARIPPDVDRVLRRALSKRGEDRFPTITAFARAFEAAAAAGAVESPARRHRRWLWLPVAVLGLALAAAAAWLVVSRRPFPGRWHDPASARTSQPAGSPTVVPLGSARANSGKDGEARRRRHDRR